MKKFFKFRSGKKGESNPNASTSPSNRSRVLRRSLGSIGSAGSGLSTGSSDWGSVLALEGFKGYQINPTDKSFTKLHKACWVGDLAKLKKHIKKVDINQIDSYSRTPLHLAAAQAHKDVIWFLLGSKAKPNQTDIDGNTPLLKAVECGHSDIVQFLLDRGSDPKHSNLNGNTGLHLVACNGQDDIAFSLIQKGANVNAKNVDGQTPLMIATVHRHVDLTQLLLRHGSSVDIADHSQKTCLMFACEEGFAEFALMFLQHGADEMTTNGVGHSSEDIARIACHEECLKVMKTFRAKQEFLPENQEVVKDANSEPLAEQQFNEGESDESSRASMVDSKADFNDDLDSWNDDISDISSKKEAVIAPSLSNFLSSIDLVHKEASGSNNGMELAIVDPEDNSVDVEPKNDSLIVNQEMPAVLSKPEGESVKNESISDKKIPAGLSMGKLELVKGASQSLGNKNDQDFMAELGLSEVSEVSTPSLSGLSLKDDDIKADATDVEDAEMIYDNPGPLVSKLLAKDEESELPKYEAKSNAIQSASQNMGSLQTVYVGVQKDGSFINAENDSDWDESEADKADGAIRIRPILLKSSPNEQTPSIKIANQDAHEPIEQKTHSNVESPTVILPTVQAAQSFESLATLKNESGIETSNSESVESAIKEVVAGEGTLGRPGTMQEIEEIWEKNPSIEVEVASTEKDIQTSQSPENVYYAQLAIVNSQESSRSNTLDERVKDVVPTKFVSEKETQDEDGSPEVRKQQWNQVLAQLLGSSNIDNDTESSDEISSVAITDQENKDSSFSSADVDQSAASVQEYVQTYQLLSTLLKDPNCSRRVIDMVQHLKLAWQKEQDKCKLLIRKLQLMKSETRKITEKNVALNSTRNDVEKDVQRLNVELESMKHSFKREENLRSDVELELQHTKSQLRVLEKKLLSEISARQQAEVTIQASQIEANLNRELLLQVHTKDVPLAVDFSSQTDDTFVVKHQATELIAVTAEKHELELEILSLTEKIDSVNLLLSEKDKMQIKLENQLQLFHQQVAVLQKDAIQANQNLSERNKELAVVIANEKELKKKIEELMENNLSTSSIIVKNGDEFSRLSKELVVSHSNLEESNLKINLLEKEAHAMNLKEQKLKNELKKQEKENEQLKLEMADLNKKLTHLQSDHLKVKLGLENATNLHQLVLEQEEAQQQILKAKEEKFVAMVSENEELKQQVEESKEQALFHTQKANLLMEKLLHSNAANAEASELKSQLTIANSKVSANEVTIKELKNKLREEQAARLPFLTMEKDFEETSKKLQLANDKCAKMEKLLAHFQENEQTQQNKLQNELENAVLQLRNAEERLKELNHELIRKDQTIQDLSTRVEQPNGMGDMHTVHISNRSTEVPKTLKSVFELQERTCDDFPSKRHDAPDIRPTTSKIVNQSVENRNDGASGSNAPGINEEHQKLNAFDLQGILSPTRISHFEASLEKLENQVEDLKRISMEGRIDGVDATLLRTNTNEKLENPSQIQTAESLYHQVELLWKNLNEVSQQLRVGTHSQLDSHMQIPLDTNSLPAHTSQKQPMQNHFNEGMSSPIQTPTDHTRVEFTRQNWEIAARQELNQQLDKINKFLEERSRATDNLEQIHKERELRIHHEYQRAVRDLRFEVRQLHDELQEKEINQKVLEEQRKHRGQLKEARKRVKAKLDKHSAKKSATKNFRIQLLDAPLASLSTDYAMTSLTTLGMSPSVPSSPIINNLRLSKDNENSFTYKFGLDLEASLAQLPGSNAVHDNQHKSNVNLSLDKTTSEYLAALKKNYLL